MDFKIRKERDYEELKELVRTFCSEHPVGSKVFYDNTSFKVKDCSVEGDRFDVEWEAPRSGLFDFNGDCYSSDKIGGLCDVDYDTRGHSAGSLEEAFEILGLNMRTRSQIGFRLGNVSYYPYIDYYD